MGNNGGSYCGGNGHTVPTAAATAGKHSGASMRRLDSRQHGASQHVCI